MATIPDTDIELLSAYLDGMLSAEERARVAQRLEREPALRAAYDDVRRITTLLHELPAPRPRRSFTLDARMPRVRRALPWRWLRPLQYAGGAAMLIVMLLGITLATTPLNQPLAMNLAAPALPESEDSAPAAAPLAAAAPVEDAASARARGADEAPEAGGSAPLGDEPDDLLAAGAQVIPSSTPAEPPIAWYLALGLAGLVVLGALTATVVRAMLVRRR